MNIHQFVEQNHLRPADVVVARKRGINVFDHYIVYCGRDDSRTPRFLLNSPELGVHICTNWELVVLLDTYKPTRIRRFSGTRLQRIQAVNRGIQEVGNGYSYWDYNCEDLANYVQFGRKHSQQAEFGKLALTTLAIFGVISLFSDNS